MLNNVPTDSYFYKHGLKVVHFLIHIYIYIILNTTGFSNEMCNEMCRIFKSGHIPIVKREKISFTDSIQTTTQAYHKHFNSWFDYKLIWLQTELIRFMSVSLQPWFSKWGLGIPGLHEKWPGGRQFPNLVTMVEIANLSKLLCLCDYI